jgi:hypothetical protein
VGYCEYGGSDAVGSGRCGRLEYSHTEAPPLALSTREAGYSEYYRGHREYSQIGLQVIVQHSRDLVPIVRGPNF